MAPKTRKETIGRKKSCELVEAGIATHGDGMALRLTEILREDLHEDEEMPDVALMYRLMGRRLGRYRVAMVGAAQSHLAELAGDDLFREMREESMSDLSSIYVAMRAGYTIGYSPAVAVSIGFEANVAVEAANLELQAQRVVDYLSTPDLVLPKPKYANLAPAPKAAVEVLQDPLKRLKEARAALNRERREADATLLAKNEAIEAYDDAFGDISRCFESGFTLGGQKELAKRFRPSVRRPGRRLVDVGGEDEPEEAAGGEEPSLEPQAIQPPAVESQAIESHAIESQANESQAPAAEGIQGG